MATRGRYAKGAERREEILTAAFAVLSRDGYAKTSLGQIGRAIGIDSAHILYYFPSREALLQEVLRRWDDDNSHAPSDPAQPFSWWIETVRRNETNRGIVQLYTAFAVEAADPDHPAHDYFAERFTRLEREVADEIRALQRSGDGEPALDARAAANLLISLSDGIQVRWLIDPGIDMAAGLQAAIARVIRT